MSPEPRPDVDGLEDGTVLTLRRSRRVDRVWQPLDALLYNMMVMNVLMGFALAFLTACLIWPRGNWVVATAISALFCSAEGLVYAFLGSSMARSGGEYYFQARILSTGAGSVFCFSAIVLGGTLWVAVTGWCAAHLAVGPLLVAIGLAIRSDGLVQAAAWVQGSWGVLLLSVVVIGWSALAIIFGLRTCAALQRGFWIVAGVTMVVVVVGLLAAGDLGSLPIYREATARAVRLGFSAAKGSPLSQTLAILPLAGYMLVYAGWSTLQAGETKKAFELRAQVKIILGAMLASALLSALLGGLVVHRLGARTLGAGAFLFFRHPDRMPLPTVPFLWFAVNSPATRIFGLVVALLFNSLFWMNAPNCTLAASRVLMAMSSDRVLPRWVGHLHSTTKAPITAIALFSAMCLPPCVVYAFTGYWRLTLNTVALVNIVAFAMTCAAGAAFPFVRRELYRESTAARHEIFGVPTITWAGSAFVLFTGWVVWRYAVDPGLSLGLGLAVPLLTALGLYAVSFALFVGSRVYRRARRGTELEVWFTEAPTSDRAF
jgi:basic amino acid/polyamine antiporter, APA family